MDNKGLLHKSIVLALCLSGIFLLGSFLGFPKDQICALFAFSLSILGTLLFWNFRLSFAFLGGVLILVTRVTTLEDFIRLSSMEIIFFLIGMMILVGFLREIGLFTYMLQRSLIVKNINAKKITFMLILTSALLACVVDEVSSIIFMIMIIFEFCDYFEVDPIPFIITSVFATNIGSAGTVLGNPIGLLIATKAGLTFEDFLKYSFPLMILSLFVLTIVIFIIFKKVLNELDEKIKIYGPNEFLIKLLQIPPDRKMKIGAVCFMSTLVLIALHHRIEIMLGLETNTVLLMAPLLTSAFIMIWRRHRARVYIEKDVEWWTLLFFIFLFAQAGVVAETGVANNIAEKLMLYMSDNKAAIVSVILFGTAFVSSALDNVVVVAGFIPIVGSLSNILGLKHLLWWAFLFGACFGGNITIVGSTANIMAIGTIEKERNLSIGFRYWLKIGIIVGISTMVFVLIMLLSLPYYK